MSAAFWDASAVVPLCCSQPASIRCRAIDKDFARGVLWWGTGVEVRSALARLAHEHALTDPQRAAGIARLGQLRRAWDEMLPSERLRSAAEDLPDRFNIRAGDAMQLAAALIWCRERTRGRAFVCFDERLGKAAEAAGFTVRA